MLNSFLKAVVRCECEENPHSKAISSKDFVVVVTISLALISRCFVIYSCREHLSFFRKT